MLNCRAQSWPICICLKAWLIADLMIDSISVTGALNLNPGSLKWFHNGVEILSSCYGYETVPPCGTMVKKFDGDIQLAPSEKDGYGALFMNSFESK